MFVKLLIWFYFRGKKNAYVTDPVTLDLIWRDVVICCLGLAPPCSWSSPALHRGFKLQNQFTKKKREKVLVDAHKYNDFQLRKALNCLNLDCH